MSRRGENLKLLKAIIIFVCLTASYLLVFVPIFPLFAMIFPVFAIVTAILASTVFSVTLLIASIFSRGRAWRAFWIANIPLTLLLGGTIVYTGLTPPNPVETLKPGESAIIGSTDAQFW